MNIRIDVDRLAALITNVRDAAETVRTYGSFGKDTIAANVPSSLYVVAALMESELRGIAQADASVGRLFGDGPPTSPEPLIFERLEAVPTHATPSPISRDVQLAELGGAVERLRTVSQQLTMVMKTRSTPTYVEQLENAAATIAAFAAALG